MLSKNKSELKSYSRIEMANPENLNAAQRLVYDKIVSGKRGTIVGPLRVVLYSPELADRWQTLGEYLRFDTDLPSEISELAIITTGRYWNSQVEWTIHSRIAAESGVSADVIEAIRTGQSPVFDNRLEALVYDFARETLTFGQVNDELYENLHELIGTAPLVELTAVIGYYSMVAMTLNVHHVPVPESESAVQLDRSNTAPLTRLSAMPPAILRNAEQCANEQ